MNQKKAKQLRKLVKESGFGEYVNYVREDENGVNVDILLGYIQRTFINEPQNKQRKGDILKEETIVPLVYGTIKTHSNSFKGKYRRMKKHFKELK